MFPTLSILLLMGWSCFWMLADTTNAALNLLLHLTLVFWTHRTRKWDCWVDAKMKNTSFSSSSSQSNMGERGQANNKKMAFLEYQQHAMEKLLKGQRNAWGVRKSFTKECCNNFLSPRLSRAYSWCYVSKQKFRLVFRLTRNTV